MEKALDIEGLLGFLRGGNHAAIDEIARDKPDILARCISYIINDKYNRYHRRNTVKSVISLLNHSSSTFYRGVAWQLIQKIQLSHLLELNKILTNRENTVRLRHAIATKLAKSKPKEILRAFFIGPKHFRDLFFKLHLPRDKKNGEEITNETYLNAYKLSTLSMPEALQTFDLSKADLLVKLNLPLDQIMNLIKTAEEGLEFAKVTNSKSFFHHIRWFRDIMGSEEYEAIAIEKMKKLYNPMIFLSNKQHLEQTQALTPKLITYLEKRATQIFEEMMKKFNLERIALIVDISGSMHVAVEITKKLYEAFSLMSGLNVTDIIAFNDTAFPTTAEELPHLTIDGLTSIGSSIVLLHQRIEGRDGANVPQAIIVVSDMDGNRAPWLSDALKLMDKYDNPPLVVLHCGSRSKPAKIDYPYALIGTNDFHKGLIMDIVKQTARLASKVAVKEIAVTKIVKKRIPIEEEVGAVELSKRPEESYKKGYLYRLLCNQK